MDRKALANETLKIMKQGWYESQGQRIDIKEWQQDSIHKSKLIMPEEAEAYAKAGSAGRDCAEKRALIAVKNADTVACIHETAPCAVLNFASAKNPGGGFLNGALAQEEALAAASGLYHTLTKHPEYYEQNRACGHMVYTNHAIYSPDVVFFRNAKGELLTTPSRAAVLTMPAVNLGQVVMHGEDMAAAKVAMKERMRMILGIFAAMGDRNLILGAYGCGVFRNDPFEVARWWKELLDEGYMYSFDSILFAVYDRSRTGNCIRAFEEEFGSFEPINS